MRRPPMLRIGAAALTCALLALALATGPVSAVEQEASLHPQTGVTCWDNWQYRWRDIADNPYDGGFREAFGGYDGVDSENAPLSSVTFTYQNGDPTTLRGHLVATGLKPNFAYQVKLVGKPTRLWGAAGNDWANERIGYAGRWWYTYTSILGKVTKGNATDADYARYKNSPRYVFEGYLLSAFFITDQYGCAAGDVAFDSSYHVLWKTTQRTPVGQDSASVPHTIIGLPGFGYAGYPLVDDVFVGSEESIYAEYEPGRALSGTLALAPGAYDVRLLLTEESFHNNYGGTTYEDGGFWQSAMVADDVSFAIVAPPQKLAFQVQPSNALVDAPIAPAVKVAVQDTYGNVVSTGTAVTLAIGANPGGGTLAGTTTVAAVSGVATFGDLSIDTAGAGYTLVASAAGLTGATSAAFAVTTPATTDTVNVTSATYTTRSRKLAVRATSSAGGTVQLKVYNAVSGAFIGSMAYSSKTKAFTYSGTMSQNPGTVLVVSSGGGSATRTVTTS